MSLLRVCSYCAAALAVLVAPLILVRAPDTPRFANLRAAERIPVQQAYSPAPDPGVPEFVNMGDPGAVNCIVRDVSATAEGAGWRWTYQKPALQFHLSTHEHLRFAMDFTIVDNVFRSTGPLTLRCSVNSHDLPPFACPRAGNYHFEHGVPSGWLEKDPVLVEASLDKLWTAPADGARLGYVLLRAGFLQ